MEKGKIYKGMSVLKLPYGSVFRVTNDGLNKGDIIMRIDNPTAPFFEIIDATQDEYDTKFWGMNLSGYTFEYIGHILTLNNTIL